MATLRYFGISFFEIVTDDGKVVYIDPCTNRTFNPACPITLDDIRRADLVLVTHMARDHSPDAIPIVEKTGASLVCGHDLRYTAIKAGVPENRVKRVPSGPLIEMAGVRVKCLRAEHGSWSENLEHPMFYLAMSYIVYVREGYGIYHVGDTSIFGDLQLYGRLYRPKVMLTPVGSRPGGSVEMDPWEAAIATGMVAPDIAIPIHYDPVGQAHFPARFAEHLKTEAPHVQVRLLPPGEVMEV